MTQASESARIMTKEGDRAKAAHWQIDERRPAPPLALPPDGKAVLAGSKAKPGHTYRAPPRSRHCPASGAAYALPRLRLLLVAPFLPDPLASHGGGSYLGTLCQGLSAEAELGLVCLVRPDEMARLRGPGSPFRFAYPVALGERPHGLSMRLHQAHMLFRWGLRGQPLVAAKTDQPGLRAAIRRAVQEWRPDAALVELAQCAQFLPELASVPTVLTDHEAAVPANTRTDLGAWADRRDARLWQRYAKRHYRRASMLQAVTQEDAAAIKSLVGREVRVRPPVAFVPPDPVARRGTKPRLLFFGSYRHDPNPEAAAIVARDVLPRVRRAVPEAELWLAGPDADRVAPLAALPGVRVVGFVPDLVGLFREVRLVVAPMYSGGGFRMKNVAALAHGIPVVTNALGARGLDVPPLARAVGESAEELAAAAIRWLVDENAAAAAGRAAHTWATANVSATAVARLQIERVNELLAAKSLLAARR